MPDQSCLQSGCHDKRLVTSHLKVSMDVCYLCHFKGVAHDQALTGCPSCHSAPTQAVPYRGKPFSHDQAAKAGHKCSRCHVEITKGDGLTPRDKCYFCHVDRVEKYPDVKLIHDRHVGQKQVDCLYCHTRIQHGKIRMADDVPL